MNNSMWPTTVFSEDFDQALLQADEDPGVWGVAMLSSGCNTTIGWVLESSAAGFLREACKDRAKLDKVYARVMRALPDVSGDLNKPIMIAYVDAMAVNAPYTAAEAAHRILKAGVQPGWCSCIANLCQRMLKPNAFESKEHQSLRSWLEYTSLETTYHSSSPTEHVQEQVSKNKRSIREMDKGRINPVRLALGMEPIE